MSFKSTIPYTSVYIDAEFRHFLQAASNCFSCGNDRERIKDELKSIWSNHENKNQVIPCLSVRTGFDLFLRVKSYPPGSEIIMSAINIPDMGQIAHHHKLKIVSLDVSIDTVGPRPELLEHLITDKTVAILVAHLYGKWFDMEPIISIAKQHQLAVIEDCAEVFCGFDKLGHPLSDISLFSFGVIKFYTAFGGSLIKIRDSDILAKMTELYESYPVQSHREYLKRVFKFFLVYIALDCPRIIKPAMFVARSLNIDHKKIAVNNLRGFPHQLVSMIRHQPSNALLCMLKQRLEEFTQSEFGLSQLKGAYVRERLPDTVTYVGGDAEVNNYWLFPVIVDNPDTFVKTLNALGVDAYRGATQLTLVEPDKWRPQLDLGASVINGYPQEAKYLIDHVVYLPVNKSVPFHVLDEICKAVESAVEMSKPSSGPKLRPASKL